MKKKLLLSIYLIVSVIVLSAQPIYNAQGIQLKHIMTVEEAALYKTVNVTKSPTPAPVGDIRPVAEFEPAEAVMVRYPFGIPISLIKEMAKDTKVITLVGSVSERNTVINQYLNNNIDTSMCKFIIHATDTYWTRDYGPWFLAINDSTVSMFDFTYNRPRYNDNQINSVLATYLSMTRYVSSLELTGGNYMNDGFSQASSTTLTFEENTGYTQQWIRNHFQEYLGIENYNFLDDPQDDYIEHIDCWGKYLAPDKVMIGQVPQSDSRYQEYEAVANYFAGLTSPYGTPMKVYRVYTPGNNQTTAYTNSLILNKKVFVPVSGNSNDAAAIAAYQAAMPGYHVFGINYSGWENTDALHCRTHEIADRQMLYIKHQPLHGDINNSDSLTLSTQLFSYGNNAIYSDSVIAYIRTIGGQYAPYHMTNTEGHTWSVNISSLPSDTIEYYIYAADQSGRKECSPYIGGADPFRFVLHGSSSVSGDANGDYSVNIYDIMTVVNYMLNLNPDPFVFNNADVNGDGQINILDVIGVVNIINNSK